MGRVARAAGTAALGLLLAGVLACVTPSGARHVVRPGENLYRISLYYGVPVQRIVRSNRVRDVHELAVGDRLLIPGSRKAQPGYALVPTGPARSAVGAVSRGRAAREANLAFDWPLRGRVSSGYGRRRGRPHEGIDIPARRGTPIRAAEAGRVIHSGRGLGAYGNVVIVKHVGRYSSVYAHNRRNRVRRGDFVEKGQVIAEVGATGNASGPHVHFEIRRDRRAVNPRSLLP